VIITRMTHMADGILIRYERMSLVHILQSGGL
jgi:hypothetical protein